MLGVGLKPKRYSCFSMDYFSLDWYKASAILEARPKSYLYYLSTSLITYETVICL